MKTLRHPRPASSPLSLLADGLLLVLLLCALGHFFLSTYLSPYYISLTVSARPTGGLLPIPVLPTLAVCLGAGVVSAAVWSLPRLRWLACLILLGAALGLIWYHWTLLAWGGQALWETLAALFTYNTGFPGYYVPDLPLTLTTRLRGICGVLAAALCLYALPLGWAVIRLRAFWGVFALTLPCLLPAFLAEIALDWPGLLVVCACWATLLLSGLAKRSNPVGGAKLTLLSLPGCLAVLLAITLVFPREGYLQPRWAVSAREELLSLDWFSLGQEQPVGPNGSDVTNAPEGAVDLSAAGPRRYTGQTALQLTTDYTGPLYLRGSTYLTYNQNEDGSGGTWTGLDSARSPSNGSGTTPSSGDYSLSLSYPEQPGTLVYTPYVTTAIGSSLLASPQLTSTLLFPVPQQEYTVRFLPLEEEPTPENGAGLASITADFSPWYTQMIYDTCLQIPQELAQALLQWYSDALAQAQADGQLLDTAAQGPYASALNLASIVTQLLERNTRYDLNTPVTPEGENFVLHFLQQSQRGYCVHYATAATLLLRSMGLPARYVTGYALRVEQTDQPTHVLDSNAHAWVEIYLEGYGWYPLEVTPASPAQASPAAEATSTPEATPTPEASPSLPPSQAPQATQRPEPASPAPEQAVPDPAGPSLSWLWAFPGAAVLASPYLLLLWRRWRWRRLAVQPDGNAAVLTLYHWFTRLSWWGGRPSPRVTQLARKARFSQHAIRPSERAEALADFRQEVRRLAPLQPRWKRLLLRLLFPVDGPSGGAPPGP